MQGIGRRAEHDVDMRRRSVVLRSTGHREPLSFDIRYDGQGCPIVAGDISRLWRNGCCCCGANAGVEKAVAMDRYRRYSERWYAQDLRRTPAQRHKGQRLEQLSTQFGIGGAADQVRDAGRFVQVHLDSDQLAVAQDEVPVLGKQSSVAFGTSILEQCLNRTELLNQFQGGLVANATYSGDVVGRIPLEGFDTDVLSSVNWSRSLSPE